MLEIDWIQLWQLNALSCSNRRLDRLITCPGDEAGLPYWAFPGRAALHATRGARADAVYDCVKNGYIELYRYSWLHDTRFSTDRLYRVQEFDLNSDDFLAHTEALLTVQGHEKWEAEFQPDWNRYWTLRDDGVSNTFDKTLSVVYASNEVLDELLRWLRAYWGLDPGVELKQVHLITTFQYPAAFWKLIPTVKMITWNAKTLAASVNEVARAAQEHKLAGDNDGAQAIWKQFKSFQHQLVAEQRQAERILRRLSKKWDCGPDGTYDCRDAEPCLRTAY